MNLRKMFFRDKQEQSVDVVDCWEVRWCGRHGKYSSDTSPQVRLFISKAEANDFKSALSDAFKLIKHTSGANVSITKQ